MPTLQIIGLLVLGLVLLGAVVWQCVSSTRKPAALTVEELRANQLDRAQRDLVDEEAEAELHAARVRMLRDRIARLSPTPPKEDSRD